MGALEFMALCGVQGWYVLVKLRSDHNMAAAALRTGYTGEVRKSKKANYFAPYSFTEAVNC